MVGEYCIGKDMKGGGRDPQFEVLSCHLPTQANRSWPTFESGTYRTWSRNATHSTATFGFQIKT